MLNPRLNRLELPGRREQYDGLIQFAVSVAAQGMASQLKTASRLAVESAALWTDRKSAELLGEQLTKLLAGLVHGEYYECWQDLDFLSNGFLGQKAQPCEEDTDAFRGTQMPERDSPKAHEV
jgi:hypothetical protein